MRRFALRYQALDLLLQPGATLVLGRDPSCDVCVDDPGASRQHARLTVAAEAVFIEDLGSRNGVVVNGGRIEGRHPLAVGDWFRIGRTEFSLRPVIGAPTPPPPSPALTLSDRTSRISLPDIEAAAQFRDIQATTLERSNDPITLILEAGRKWLDDQHGSLLERFSSALEMVELLWRAQAADEARLLLRESFALLGERQAAGVLPPSVAARARECLRQLAPSGPTDWQQHTVLLERAEGLALDERGTGEGGALRSRTIETELRAALAAGHIRVCCQPIVDLATGRISSFEALCRWHDPKRGDISPSQFIPVLEESELIVSFGEEVLRQSCTALGRWRSRFPELGTSVNVSSRQFQSPDLVGQVEQALREAALDPAALTLELTESAIMADARLAATVLLELRTLGVRISVDDFGTGYSSLAYLHQFPISALKIDQSFVARLGTERQNVEIVRTIVTLAHSLNLAAVAEGIETDEQLHRLRSFRCDYGQGYLFARPLETDAFERLLASDARW